ncbi:MAG: type II secretion system F family protein [Deltaproteobacteria bacterium]|nr:MAG: type II secretion system F family protein [Deltaproteobacteria bacterium]
MSVYTYRARDEKGSLIAGETEAADEGEVMAFLSGRNLMPLSIKKGKGSFDLAQLEKMMQPGVSGEEILVMTRQFYTLFKAGMSMEAILSTLIRQTQNKAFQGVLQDIQNSVSGGDGLSKAFNKHRKIFGDLYVSMLAAGE